MNHLLTDLKHQRFYSLIKELRMNQIRIHEDGHVRTEDGAARGTSQLLGLVPSLENNRCKTSAKSSRPMEPITATPGGLWPWLGLGLGLGYNHHHRVRLLSPPPG